MSAPTDSSHAVTTLILKLLIYLWKNGSSLAFVFYSLYIFSSFNLKLGYDTNWRKIFYTHLRSLYTFFPSDKKKSSLHYNQLSFRILWMLVDLHICSGVLNWDWLWKIGVNEEKDEGFHGSAMSGRLSCWSYSNEDRHKKHTPLMKRWVSQVNSKLHLEGTTTILYQVELADTTFCFTCSWCGVHSHFCNFSKRQMIVRTTVCCVLNFDLL